MSVKKIIIDFLFLDLSQCTRCQGTDSTLEESLNEVAGQLEKTGHEVVVNKVQISSPELARKYKFLSSPTIRVNGKDIQMDVVENNCESCGDLCGDSVDCRVFVYEGKEYEVPPSDLIIASIMSVLDDDNNNADDRSETEEPYMMPENLVKFFKGIEEK